MREDEKKAELEAKGIVAIVITIDNWDQYFEYAPTGSAYIRNAFGEITHMNMTGGLKLKDEYILVKNGGTSVSFEIETYIETRICTIDFTTGTFEYGDIIKKGTNLDTTTARFQDYYYTLGHEELGFGSIAQVNNKNGQLIATEVSIAAISQMLRAEGVLYIYQS